MLPSSTSVGLRWKVWEVEAVKERDPDGPAMKVFDSGAFPLVVGTLLIGLMLRLGQDLAVGYQLEGNWGALQDVFLLALPVTLIPLLQGLTWKVPERPVKKFEVALRPAKTPGEVQKVLAALGVSDVPGAWLAAVQGGLRKGTLHLLIAKMSPEFRAKIPGAGDGPAMDARTRELQHLVQQAREGVVCCGVVLRLPSEQCAGSGLGIDIEPSRSVAVMELPYLGLPSLFIAPSVPIVEVTQLVVEVIDAIKDELGVHQVIVRAPAVVCNPLVRVGVKQAGSGVVDLPAACTLPTPYQHYETYLAALPASTRRDLRRKERKFRALGGSVEVLKALEDLPVGADLAEPFSRQYTGVLRHLRPLTRAVLAQFGGEPQFKLLVAKVAGEIQGMLVLVHDRDHKHLALRLLYTDEKKRRTNLLFFNLLIGGVQFAIMNGVQAVDMGPGSEQVKRRMGAQVRKEKYILRGQSRSRKPVTNSTDVAIPDQYFKEFYADIADGLTQRAGKPSSRVRGHAEEMSKRHALKSARRDFGRLR